MNNIFSSSRCLANKSRPQFSNSDMPSRRLLIRREIMQNSLTEIQVRTPEATRPEQASRKDQQPSRRQDLKRPSGSTGTFRRKITNSNGETCWLNSGLQMILCSLDHSQSFQSVSSLGFNMELNQAEELIDPSTIKLLIQTEININDIRQKIS